MAKNSIPMNDASRNFHNENEKNILLYQDTALLIELLQLSHQYYKARSVLSEEAFIAFLQELIEWLETTYQLNTAHIADYHIHSIEFYRYIYKGLWKYASTLEPFFNAIAYLIQYGIENFRAEGYPKSYETFLYKLELIFNNDQIIQSGKQRSAYLLLEQLRKKPF